MRCLMLVPALLSLPMGVAAQDAPSDCCTRFDYKLEKTILKVDALQLRLEILDGAADRVARLVGAWSRLASVEDSVAQLYLGSRKARAHMTFLISASLTRFLGGTGGTMRHLADVGLISEPEADALYADYVGLYSALEDRGIKDGDVMERSLTGDTLSMRFTAADGEVLIEEIRVGSEHRRAFLGAFFGPGSDFRDGLIDQVFERVSRP